MSVYHAAGDPARTGEKGLGTRRSASGPPRRPILRAARSGSPPRPTGPLSSRRVRGRSRIGVARFAATSRRSGPRSAQAGHRRGGLGGPGSAHRRRYQRPRQRGADGRATVGKPVGGGNDGRRRGRLEAFMGKMIGHMTGGAICYGIWLGDELGLYRELAGTGPRTADRWPKRPAATPRLVREWLDGQAAGGLVAYDADADTYELGPEAAMALADDTSPVFVARGMNAFGSMFMDMQKIAAAFRGNGALSWGDHHPCLFCGTEWFFRTGYRAYLHDRVDPGARRRRGEAQGRRARRRRRLRPRRVGRGDGRRLSRTRRSAGSTSTRRRSRRPRAGRRGGGGRARRLRGRDRDRLPGRVRPDLLLRLPARHGRPGRRRPARPRAPAARRHGAAGRAVRPRPAAAEHRREPDGGPDLRGVVVRLHAELAVAGGRRSASAPRPARRGCAKVFEEAGFRHFRRAAQTPMNLILEARA